MLKFSSSSSITVSHTPISTLHTSMSVSVKRFGSALAVAAAPFFAALPAGFAFSSFAGLAAAAFGAAPFGALAAGAAFSALALAGALPAALLALPAGAAAVTGSSSRVRLPRVPAMLAAVLACWTGGGHLADVEN